MTVNNPTPEIRERELENQHLKTLFFRGLLVFYIVNLVGVLLGVFGIETLGRTKGIAFMLLTIAALQVMAGYVILKLGDTF